MSEQNAPAETDDAKRVREAVQTLMEFFDTVQVFCTRYMPGENGGTKHWIRGDGDIFARESIARMWVLQQEEKIREQQRKEEESQ